MLKWYAGIGLNDPSYNGFKSIFNFLYNKVTNLFMDNVRYEEIIDTGHTYDLWTTCLYDTLLYFNS